MANDPTERPFFENPQVIYAGMAAVAVGGVYEVFGREEHHWADFGAVWCFAVAIPLLTVRFLMVRFGMATSTPWVNFLCGCLDFTGIGGTIVGFTCVLGSFSLHAIGLFWGAALLAVLLILFGYWLDRGKGQQAS